MNIKWVPLFTVANGRAREWTNDQGEYRPLWFSSSLLPLFVDYTVSHEQMQCHLHPIRSQYIQESFMRFHGNQERPSSPLESAGLEQRPTALYDNYSLFNYLYCIIICCY